MCEEGSFDLSESYGNAGAVDRREPGVQTPGKATCGARRPWLIGVGNYPWHGDTVPPCA